MAGERVGKQGLDVRMVQQVDAAPVDQVVMPGDKVDHRFKLALRGFEIGLDALAIIFSIHPLGRPSGSRS